MTQAPELITLTIDDTTLSVPKGTLVIRAAEMIGVQIPRFCDHPLLDPVGACRQCLVEVEGQRKPMASCTITATEGMVVRTQFTSAAADKAQQGVMELLLINHPLDCPVCDKGGECPLQNQAMSAGRPETRFTDAKRTFPKPISLSAEVLLDRERCVLCARCTRFSQQIAGDPFIELLERGALQQVGIAAGEPFDSYFSGNTVQICPVGALTGRAYRFRARPFDLVSSPSVCEHCASGCAQRTDHRRGVVLRRLAGDDPDVNEEWNCDKGRWAFTYARTGDRLTTPMVRDDGTLRTASWSEALTRAAAGLAAGRTGVLVGGRVTAEDAYAYSKFTRIALDTNDIDMRARPCSDEETAFLAARVAGQPMTVTYADLESAPVVVLAGFEPEEESPIVFLRLRKAVRNHGHQVITLAPFASRGTAKLAARMVPTTPGGEAAALDSLTSELDANAVILVGERLATSPGALSAACRLAQATGARLAWIPRRAGEPGAVHAGCLPTLLPGGRPAVDPLARLEIYDVWNVAELPVRTGRDTTAILEAAARGELDALVVGGVEPADLADPAAALAAISAAGFVVSLEIRESAVTALADVVFPVAPVTEKAGSFVNWEGRMRPFDAALPSTAMSDLKVLHTLAAELGHDLALPDAAAARAEMDRLGAWTGRRHDEPTTPAGPPPPLADGDAVLAGWRMLLDAGRLQDGEPYLAGTARPPVARLSAATAASLGAGEGDLVTVSTARGGVSLPLAITEMPDQVVWLPLNSPTSAVHTELGVTAGSVVRIAAGRFPVTHPDPAVFGHDPWWLITIKAVAVFAFLLLTVLVAILVERKLLGRMQMRYGPNRVGPFGILQSLIDGIKLALKEGLVPAGVDKPIYLMAPVISVITAILAFAVVPLGPVVSVFGHSTPLQLTDLPVGVLYILAITSIGVYGIVLAGWASGSIYPLLGGLRSSAQVVSYEIAMALTFAAVFLCAGTMSTSGIVAAQTHIWYVVLLLPSFLVYLTAMVGETNRAPFDLPEAEGELVGGFHTEYSSLKFAMFYLAEYVNMTTVSALASTLFLGGWRAPWPISLWEGFNTGWWPLLWFVAKVWTFLFVFMWLRATLPRLRYDQFMALGWKLLIPVSLVWIIIVACLRITGNTGAIPSLLAAAGLMIALLALNTLRRSRIRRNAPPPPPPAGDGGFPVPPLPPAPKETARA